MGYVATVNVPGYLPMSDDPPVFDTAQAAWQYLSDEAQQDGEGAWLPDDPEDPNGPYSMTEWAVELERRADSDLSGEGTVYGHTPGRDPRDEDNGHDLGLAYSVTYTDETPEDGE